MSLQELYKSGMPLAELQEARRQQILKQQKQKRADLQDELRTDLADTITADAAFVKRKKSAHFQQLFGMHLGLQTAEWLRAKPADLDDWLLVPYPLGQRVLLVATNAYTHLYNKNGRCFYKMRTLLPGANKSDSIATTILDCVFNKEHGICYVLDVLLYNSMSMIDAEAEFRFYWLRIKFEENPQFSQRSKHNELQLQLLPHKEFTDKAAIDELLLRHPFWPVEQVKLEAFVFYHKRASYECKQSTPLMCWLLPFMFPDVLGLSVHKHYETPVDYENAAQYMHLFDAKNKAKQAFYYKKRMPKSSAREVMDVLEELEHYEDNAEEEEEQQTIALEQQILETSENAVAMLQ